MPVKHDLYADLHITKDEIATRRGLDPKLNHLIIKYEEIDADIVEAERAPAGDVQDEALKKLKEHRLAAKDAIVSRLGPAD